MHWYAQLCLSAGHLGQHHGMMLIAKVSNFVFGKGRQLFFIHRQMYTYI